MTFLLIFISPFKPRTLINGFNRIRSLTLIVIKNLYYEFRLPIGVKVIPFLIQMFLILFLITCVINFIGLTPYTFTPSSSISLTIRIAISIWIFIEIRYFIIALSSFLSHLVPSGTPSALIPLIVLIELVRNIIRPITLSVRLAANIVAGHLLISLVNGGRLSFITTGLFLSF